MALTKAEETAFRLVADICAIHGMPEDQQEKAAARASLEVASLAESLNRDELTGLLQMLVMIGSVGVTETAIRADKPYPEILSQWASDYDDAG